MNKSTEAGMQGSVRAESDARDRSRSGKSGASPSNGASGRALRIAWAFGSIVVVETVVFALALLPPGVVLALAVDATRGAPVQRVIALALLAVPALLVFTVGLMIWSALATRALGWRTQPDLRMPIAEVGWPLLKWGRGMVLQHFTRLFAGSLYRASPLWTFYIRLNGARIGRGVYINTLSIMDHSLLEIGEGTVIGSDVHLGGHWAERGVIHTARTVIGPNVMIGNSAVLGIGVKVGEGAQVGALTVVPKYTRITAGTVYLGVRHPSE